MPPKTIISKRNKFFQGLQTDTVSHGSDSSDPASSLPHNHNQIAMLSDTIISKRKKFFQELQIHTEPHNSGSSELADSLPHDPKETELPSTSRIVRRKQCVDGVGVVETNETNMTGPVLNFGFSGQASYQKSHLGITVDYKDIGDDSYICTYCDAYFWFGEALQKSLKQKLYPCLYNMLSKRTS